MMMKTIDKQEVIEKLKRARIQIQSRNPFFSYLSLFIKWRADDGELPEYAGMGVNIKGDLVYKPEFIDSISDEELIGVLCHEILHLSLIHLTRRGSRKPDKWNWACDLCVNTILQANKFELPSGCVECNYNDYAYAYYNSYKFDDENIIENVSEKSAEQIYEEMPDRDEQQKKGFDEHIEDKKLTEKEKDEIKNKWLEKVSEAYVTAKQKGELPSGIEKLLGKLHKEQINWKAILSKYITSLIPSDYTYAKPSKKSISVGCYLPSDVKEKIEIAVVIDTSGSIGNKELTEFLSEIVGIARNYREKIDMRVITADTEVKQDLEVRNGNVEKIKQLKITGGGGTSHKQVTEYIAKKHRNMRAVVFFTDGESDLDTIEINKLPYESIFILNSRGTDRQLRGQNVKVIKLRDGN